LDMTYIKNIKFAKWARKNGYPE